MTDESDPVQVARRFLQAISWGEHTVVWRLLSDSGRSIAISVGLANGLDRTVAGRISDERAGTVELDEFLQQLIGGLRHDLRSVELDELRTAARAEVGGDGTLSIDLLSPSSIPGTGDWSAGRIVLRELPPGSWRVDRLEPVIAGP